MSQACRDESEERAETDRSRLGHHLKVLTMNEPNRAWMELKGNGKPLQYSCLENPVGRGAWWATVHGVAESRTQLSARTTTAASAVLREEAFRPPFPPPLPPNSPAVLSAQGGRRVGDQMGPWGSPERQPGSQDRHPGPGALVEATSWSPKDGAARSRMTLACFHVE